MKVLVAYASANGSTAGIAARIRDRLAVQGVEAEAAPLGSAAAGLFDALVVGSAIHTGKWLRGAAAQAEQLAEEAPNAPLWLFSVSSVGETSGFFGRRVAGFIRKRRPENKELAQLRGRAGFRGHRNFAGAIRPGDWGRVGTVVLRLAGGKLGDHRDWEDIDRWADRIAETLAHAGAAGPVVQAGAGGA